MFILRFFLRPDSLRLMILCLLVGGVIGLAQTVTYSLTQLRDCTAPQLRTHPECQDEVVLLLNGQIHTATEPAVVEALAVSRGRVVSLGSAETLRQKFPSAVKVDLGGNVCLPAFQDPGIWLLAGALGPLTLDLSSCQTVEDWQEPISAALRTQPGQWLFGYGWHPPEGDGLPLNRKVLDVMSPDRPVFLWSATLESALLSTSALEALEIRRGTPSPLYGRIHRDPSGHPTGLLEGEAAAQAFRRAAQRVEGPRLKQALLEAQTLLFSQGIVRVGTEVQDELTDVIALGELQEAGAFRLRVHGHPLQSVRKSWPFRHYRAPDPSALRIEGTVITLDGSPLFGQAAEQWESSPGRGRILPRFTLPILRQVLARSGAGPARLDAQGTLALGSVLEVLPGIELRHPPLLRSRTWHPDLLEAVCSRGGIPLLEPAWVGYSPEGLRTWLHPPEQAEPPTSFPLPSSCRPVLSSGWPAGRANLREVIDLARSLAAPVLPSLDSTPPAQGPAEHSQPKHSHRRGQTPPPPPPPAPYRPPLPTLRLDQALSAATLNVARAYGLEETAGTLAPGSFADLVVLEGNPLTQPDVRLASAEVVMTLVGGEVVWRRESGLTLRMGALELTAPTAWRKLLARQYFWILSMSMAMLSWPVLSLLVWIWKRPHRARRRARVNRRR